MKKNLKICLAIAAIGVIGVQVIIMLGCTIAQLTTGQCNTAALSEAIMIIPLGITFMLWVKAEEDFKS